MAGPADFIGAIATMVGDIFKSASAVNIKKYEMREQQKAIDASYAVNATNETAQRTDYIRAQQHEQMTLTIIVIIFCLLLLGLFMYLTIHHVS